MSVDRLSEFRQSFAKNRHLAVRFGMIPVEVPLEALKEFAEARGYVVGGKRMRMVVEYIQFVKLKKSLKRDHSLWRFLI